MSNLPDNNDSKETRNFFDNYFSTEVSFPSNQIDAVLGFFMRRGFDEEAARTTGIVLLNQARIDNVNIFELLDKLKNFTNVQLGQVVTQILNYYRIQTSVLGYKTTRKDTSFESRNILV